MNKSEQEKLKESIENQREMIKDKFEINDEQFNLLIKNVILNTFDKLKIKLSTDDPIFALLLSQKEVMEYYTEIVSKQLILLPNNIKKSINESYSELNLSIDNKINNLQKKLNEQTIDLNNKIIDNYNNFINKKSSEIKNILQTNYQSSNKIQNICLIFLTALLFLISFTSCILFFYQQKEIEETTITYEQIISKSLTEIQKGFSKKDYEKIQKIFMKNLGRE